MLNWPVEITVLLMACTLDASTEKQAQVSQFVTQHPPDWNRLFQLATRHRLTPFLYRTLRNLSVVPEPFLTNLQQDCRIIATDNLLKLHQYHLVSTLLTENGIDHLSLKGIRLAQRSYPDSSLRSSGDMDVLVSEEDVSKTVQLLQAHDYQLNPQHEVHWQQARQTIFTDLYEVSLTKPFFNGSHFDLDLHWQIVGFNKHYASFDLAYVRSEPTFTTEREVVLLVLHHGVTNIWQQLYYINDLYFLLTEKPLDWPSLMQEFRKFGLEGVFLAGLYWCRHIWNLEVPTFVQALVDSAETASLAKTYAENWNTEQPYEVSQLIARQLFFFLKSQTQVSNQLKIGRTFLSSRLFRYSLFKVGNRLLYVPPEAGILTILIRAFQSLLRFRQ